MELLSIKLASQRTKYMKRRVKYYPNSVALFNILLLAGDIETNPGDVKNPCSVCARSVAKNHRAISCDSCQLLCHIRCGGVSPVEYNRLASMATFCWICSACICRALPFYNDIVADEPYFRSQKKTKRFSSRFFRNTRINLKSPI